MFLNGYEVSVMYDGQLNRDLLYNTVSVVNNTDLHPLKYIKRIGDWGQDNGEGP